MGNAQWKQGIMLFEADVGTDEHTTLFSHHCCLATERTNGFSAFLIKLIQKNDATKFCHKFSPALATMFTSVEFINHAGDDSFL